MSNKIKNALTAYFKSKRVATVSCFYLQCNAMRMQTAVTAKGFCQVEQNKKIREKLGSGWVRQAPTQIFFLGGGGFVFFVLFLCFQMLKKKKLKGGWVALV